MMDAIDRRAAGRESTGGSIETLPFTDLYICLDDRSVTSRFRADPTRINRPGNLPIPERYAADIEELRNQVIHADLDNGTLTYKGIRLRYIRFTASEGQSWAALRGVPLDLPSLGGLRMHPKFVSAVRGWGRRKGLIVVCGKTGDGKTTTCVAAIRDYLETFGGLAYTIEDPPEFQMQGAISERGFCLQVEVHGDDHWGDAVKAAMRCRPDILFLGEIRTSHAAEQLLKAVTSGHLVVTTVHGGAVPDAIAAIVQLAETAIGTSTARSILADRLVAVVHQSLAQDGPTATVLEIPRGGASEGQVVGIIANGDLSSLGHHCATYQPERTRQ